MRPRKVISRLSNRLVREMKSSLAELDKKSAELATTQQQILLLQRQLEAKIQKDLINRGTYTLADDEIIAKIFSGAKFYLDPRDVGLVPHLVLDGEWEHDITEAWLSTVKEQDVVLDIGANFGYFGILAAQQTYGNLQSILFEANPNLIPYLQKTVEVNSFGDCTIIENLAVSEKPGRAHLNILKDYIASSSLHSVNELNRHSLKKDYALAETVEVPATTIDRYCSDNHIKALNLIKMDIEGFEDRAYSGMREMIRKSPDVTLFIEFTKGGYKDPEAFYDQMLADFGHVYAIQPGAGLKLLKDVSYTSVIEGSNDWTMPVFSKNAQL